MSEKLKNFINYTLIGLIFTEAFYFKFKPFYNIRDYFYYIKIYHLILPLLFFILVLYKKRISNNKNFIIILTLLTFFSLFNVFIGWNNPVFCLKQVFGIIMHSTIFYMLIKLNDDNISKLFSIYLRIAFIIALVGAIQAISYYIYHFLLLGHDHNIKFFFNFSYLFPRLLPSENWRLTFCQLGIRVNSLLPEPASFCFVVFPAFFVSLYTIIWDDQYFLSKPKRLVIILTYFLTFSLIGYIGVIFSLLFIVGYKFKNNSIKKYPVFILAFLLLIAFSYVPEINRKIVEFKSFFSGQISWRDTNQSMNTLIRHALVTQNVLKDDFLIGHGLGSHLISSEEHIERYQIKHRINFEFLNQRDAGSLLLRVLSETGLLGTLILIFFIFYNFLPAKKLGNIHIGIINNSIFILFILRLIRQGNYFSEGFFFFFWMYYFSKLEIKKLSRQNENTY